MTFLWLGHITREKTKSNDQQYGFYSLNPAYNGNNNKSLTVWNGSADRKTARRTYRAQKQANKDAAKQQQINILLRKKAEAEVQLGKLDREETTLNRKVKRQEDTVSNKENALEKAVTTAQTNKENEITEQLENSKENTNYDEKLTKLQNELDNIDEDSNIDEIKTAKVELEEAETTLEDIYKKITDNKVEQDKYEKLIAECEAEIEMIENGEDGGMSTGEKWALGFGIAGFATSIFSAIYGAIAQNKLNNQMMDLYSKNYTNTLNAMNYNNYNTDCIC